MNFFLF